MAPRAVQGALGCALAAAHVGVCTLCAVAVRRLLRAQGEAAVAARL